MKLLLTDDEGTVLETWSIAFKYDEHPTDDCACNQHDFYFFVDEHLKDRPEVYFREVGDEVGKTIAMEREIALERGKV